MAMWALLLKNDSGGDITVEDLGLFIADSTQSTVSSQFTYDDLAGSDDLRALVTAGTLVVNDGTFDLSAVNGVKYLTFQNLYKDTSGGGSADLEDIVGFGVISINNIKAGIKGYKTIPFNCSITGWDVDTNIAGNIAIDILKGVDTQTNVVGAGTKPFLDAETSNSGNASDWDENTLTAGDILVFDVQAGSTIKKIVATISVLGI